MIKISWDFKISLYLYRLHIHLEARDRIDELSGLVRYIRLEINPFSYECVGEVSQTFANKILAFACGGGVRKHYVDDSLNDFIFPSKQQKEHFLFLTGHLRKKEKSSVYSREPDEISLDDIPF